MTSTISRNAPCPCGSGKRFKHCCGRYATAGPRLKQPSPESVARMHLELARMEARERQRRLMQGLGRPIISFEDHGYRIVAVGNELRWSKAWRTFPDFLFDYIKYVFTPEWGNAELKKPEGEQHPLLGWYRKVCLFQRAHLGAAQGTISEAPMTGAVRAYLGLACDLYLCAHNAELPDLLVKRLRNPRTFEGAVYEAHVIGSMAKAGFRIEFEDESDSTRSHCEFTATHSDTGRKFSVEAKAVTSSSSRAGASTAPLRVRGKLFDALRKRADHDRIVFIELNRAKLTMTDGLPDWAQGIDAELAQAEKELTIDGAPAPAAYIFVTNRGFVHALDSAQWTEVGMACGFKIDDFASRTGAPSILDLAKAREGHIEMHWLRKALNNHRAIPNSFDDKLGAEAFDEDNSPRLLIGSTYLIPDETGGTVPGLLMDGAVLAVERAAYGTYRLQDGRHVMCKTPLTDAELEVYKRSPDTFFGVVKEVPKNIQEPLDCFDFHWLVYARTPKEKLLEFMATWPDVANCAHLQQKDLAQVYCARMAEYMWNMHSRAAATKSAAA
jgi:hypothetical protein